MYYTVDNKEEEESPKSAGHDPLEQGGDLVATLGLDLLEDLQLYDAVRTTAGNTQDVGAWWGVGGGLTFKGNVSVHKG